MPDTAKDITFPGFSIFSPSTWAAVWADWCGPNWSAGKRDANLSAAEMAELPVAESPPPEGGKPRECPIDKTCHEHDTAYLVFVIVLIVILYTDNIL